MSFKRDGHDFGWLDRIRKRRIDELFSADIPEDEALLMKNGRFCCLVCSYRPIFDTVHMLTIHRGGKRHIGALEKAEEKKAELELLKLKRLHESYSSSSGDAPFANVSQGKTGSLALATATPYEPRLKKKKFHDRKERINFNEDQTSNNYEVSPSTSFKTVNCQGSLAPYEKGHNQAPALTKSDSANVPHSASANKKSNYQKSLSDNIKSSHSNSRPTGEFQSHLGENNEISPSSWPSNSKLRKNVGTVVSSHSDVPTFSKGLKKKAKTNTSAAESTTVDEEKLKLAAKYLQARGAGWMKDLSGKWVREDDVEFDSDEEPPDLP